MSLPTTASGCLGEGRTSLSTDVQALSKCNVNSTLEYLGSSGRVEETELGRVPFLRQVTHLLPERLVLGGSSPI